MVDLVAQWLKHESGLYDGQGSNPVSQFFFYHHLSQFFIFLYIGFSDHLLTTFLKRY